ETATEVPNASPPEPPMNPSEALSVADIAQPAAGFTNTYAMPSPLFAPTAWAGAPATTVSPSIATDDPSPSPAAGTLACNSPVWIRLPDQPPAGSTNTYAAPAAGVNGAG